MDTPLADNAAIELLERIRLDLRAHLRKVRRNEDEIMSRINATGPTAELEDVERALNVLRTAPGVFRAAVGNEVAVRVPQKAYEALRDALA